MGCSFYRATGAVFAISILAACGGGGSGSSESEGPYLQPRVVAVDAKYEFAWSASAIGDFNNDGHADMLGALTTNNTGGVAKEVVILINDGNGMLEDQTESFIIGDTPEYFTVNDAHVADLNGDNRDDIFLSNSGKELPGGPAGWPCERDALFLSQPDGRLRDVTASNLPAVIGYSHGSALGDIDVDGDLDIWVNNIGCQNTQPGHLLQNNGAVFTGIADTASPAPIFGGANGILPPGFGNVYWTAFVDANGDGAADLFFTNINDNGLLLNNGSGVFSLINDGSIPDTPGSTTQDIEVFDVNQDGLDDIILFQNPDDFSPGHRLRILISDGNGGFNDQTDGRLPLQESYTSMGAPEMWIGDINGDGRTDMMVVMFGPNFDDDQDVIDFYLNDGDGFFTEVADEELPVVEPLFTPLDVNGDGKVDFVYPDFNEDGEYVLMLTLSR